MVSADSATSYCSTRGGAKGVSFEDVVLGGLAEDRGLYVPEKLPIVSAEELAEVRVRVNCCPPVCLSARAVPSRLTVAARLDPHTSRLHELSASWMVSGISMG